MTSGWLTGGLDRSLWPSRVPGVISLEVCTRHPLCGSHGRCSYGPANIRHVRPASFYRQARPNSNRNLSFVCLFVLFSENNTNLFPLLSYIHTFILSQRSHVLFTFLHPRFHLPRIFSLRFYKFHIKVILKFYYTCRKFTHLNQIILV